ncbi:non-ribosomal peptide synthetase module [Lasiosphaeria hispida]|uniref:Non-ribosomal peptide synthetase module n=1 Tax=Lasiosphaeria hispida TaxID=260671 RepID=A0AAJ0H4Y1_9PEZI|nr:non-ribosomal peptide synthetase module [Lasiosphaeria hispida]
MAYHGPSQNTLRDIWAEVLHDDAAMFADEDVFFEVGGDSVRAQKLISAAKSRGIFLTMEQIFLNAALSEMAEVARVVVAPSAVPTPFSWLGEGLGDRVEMMAQKCNVAVPDIENAYPCSPMQESLLVELDDRKTLYLRQIVFRLASDIGLDHFRQAWQDTIGANPVLRTRICHVGGGLGHVQAVVRKELEGQWSSLHFDLQQFLERDAANPMRTGEPFFRYAIVVDEDSAGDTERHFVWTVHHALCDGTSIPEILSEVSRRFREEAAPAREPFESFVRSAAVTPADMSSEQNYWKRALSGINPTPYPPMLQDAHLHFEAEPTSVLERTVTLDRVPLLGGVTRALLLRAAWAILLSHYTGTEDVGFGAVNNGRTAAVPGATEMTGPTINLVPIALHLDVEESVASFLSRVRVQAAEMMPFEHAGMARIRKHLDGHDSTAVGFQTLFVVHPMSFEQAIAPATLTLGLEYVDALGKKEHHSYPLVLTLTLSAGATVNLSIQHDERVVPTWQAENMAHHFECVLSQLSKATRETKLGSISPFSQHDLRQIREWNADTPPAEETCIHHLFQNQVLKQPHAVAVCSVDESLSYLDVDTCSSSLALQLVDLGVCVGTFVGVCFEKSIWTVVAILAVFKAGGVYVPVDPAHPRSRIEEQVQRVGIEVALASGVGTEILRGLCRTIITVNSRPLDLPAHVKPPFSPLPSSIAYLLFTSGSTGKPKGLLMSHSAICTSIVHHGRAFAAGPHWRTLQFGAHTFDLSIGEFFTTLAHGGCICVPSEHDRLNNLAGAIAALDANTLLVVPTVANLLRPEDAPSLRTIVLAGEPITKETVTRWAGAVALACAYGPSETAVWCSGNLGVSADAHPANIGRSIGATMWIVHPDNHSQLSAIGCVGEIVISGGLLGAGYFGDKAITDAAWVPAPDWLREIGSGYEMLYRSGDLARYNPDGTFQIVGRRDTQVKLRGFRIELGEIENQLMATGMITAALAALPTAGPCAKHIVAVVCSTKPDLKNHDGGAGGGITVSQEERPLLGRLSARLARSLPDYMIPTVWITLVEMPLLISGKIDRRSIKSWIQNMDYDLHRELVEGPDVNENPGLDIVPGSLADRLRQLWGEVLGVPTEHIGMRTSFISIGGDSITAIQIVSQAKRRLGLSATVRSIISTKTLEHLVTLVQESSSLPKANPESITSVNDTSLLLVYHQILQSRLRGKPPSVQVEQVYPLAPFQREIMKARELNPAVFLLSWQMEVFPLTTQPVSLGKLAQAWRRVVQKHTVLRSIFLRDPDGNLAPAQAVLTRDAEPEVAIYSASSGEAEPSFATTKTPPVDQCFLPHRALFSQHGERYFAHIELDHLVIDGWSLKLIKEAFLAAYEEEEAKVHVAEDEAPSYQAFVAAHYPDRIKADDKHWASALRNHQPSLLSLPVASTSPDTSPSPEKTIFYLPEIPATALKPLGVEHTITPASIFDAAWAQTLSVYTRSPNVTFEYVVSGREEDVPGVFDMVGPLINVLPYHIHLEYVPSENDSPAQLAYLAQRMQQQRDQDGSHTASNVREVIERELGVQKLFNTALNFQRRPTAVQTERLRVDDDLRKSRDPWHFDILVRVMHITDDDTFKPSFEFDARFFNEDGMMEVAQEFWRRVQAVIS